MGKRTRSPLPGGSREASQCVRMKTVGVGDVRLDVQKEVPLQIRTPDPERRPSAVCPDARKLHAGQSNGVAQPGDPSKVLPPTEVGGHMGTRYQM